MPLARVKPVGLPWQDYGAEQSTVRTLAENAKTESRRLSKFRVTSN
jgi:hypothetical protein